MLLSETTGDETLRYYYDSTGKVASLVYQKGDEDEVSYFYTRNAQGDIIGVYRSKDSKLMGTYEYDLWGRLISAASTEDDTNNILEENPYRYRGYYYDSETGFYYLTARYYDPQIRRFISADSMNALMIATTDVTCKNLFAYAENNPVTNKDSSGEFAETVLDVVTLVGSVGEVFCNPTDVGAWVNAGADIVDVAVPFVTGVGEAVRGVRAGAKAAEAAETVTEAAKASSKILRQNLIEAGTEVPQYANAAHHIVAGNAKGAEEARKVLEKFKIGINDAENGVFLPIEKGVSDAVYHPSLHTNVYYDRVNDILNQSINQQDTLDALKYISETLQNGTFMK